MKPAIHHLEDWDLVQAVPATVPPLADQVEAVRLVAAALGPDVPVIQTVFSPLSVADFMLGEKEFAQRFGKSEAHSCGSHAKCGAASKIINWVPTSAEECKDKGGYIVEEVGSPKKKVAKKA